jgi:hypothetical protein
MLDPFNDGEAMTEMSNPNNHQEDQARAMNGYMANMDGQQPDASTNMQIDDY